MTKIYLASSWRNEEQPDAVEALKGVFNENGVYDFKNPYHTGPNARMAGNTTLERKPVDGGGFQWSDIDRSWQWWTPWAFTQALEHSVAEQGYKNDIEAMLWADVCVMLLPCGRSAHIEAGFFAGHPDKRLYIVLPAVLGPAREGHLTLWEPELMYKMADGIFLSIEDLLEAKVL